jgi:hypothetical protein
MSSEKDKCYKYMHAIYLWNVLAIKQWTRRELNPHCQHARLASSRWTTGPLSNQSGEWGSNPRSPASKAGGLPFSYPLFKVDRRGVEPRFPGCDPGVFPSWTSSPRLPETGSSPGWIRTSDLRHVRVASTPGCSTRLFSRTGWNRTSVAPRIRRVPSLSGHGPITHSRTNSKVGRIRTHSAGFGDRLLSQEHDPVGKSGRDRS